MKPGAAGVTGNIHNSGCVAVDVRSNHHDGIPANGDVAAKPGAAGAVDDSAVLQQKIERRLLPMQPSREVSSAITNGREYRVRMPRILAPLCDGS
mgnify:CR=1 FL=1